MSSKLDNLLVVVVGCGRYGSNLANRLSPAGHSVIVLDRNPDAFDALTSGFTGFKIEADATEFASLRDAKLDQSDLVVAATDSDHVNILVAQVARRILGARRVVARVSDPRREEVFRELDIETVSPTALATDFILSTLHRQAHA